MADDIKLKLIFEAVNKTGAQAKKVVDDIEKINKATLKVGHGVKIAAKPTKEWLKQFQSGAEKSGVSLKNLNKHLGDIQTAGLSLIGIGTALSAAIVFPVKSAGEFEKAMSGVRAVLTATEDQFRKLSEEAKRLGARTRFTATEAAEGMRFLAMAGLTAEEAFSALEPALNLAAAGQLSVSDAADIATNIMSAMNIEVSGLNHVMDALAFTAANSNTNIQQMAEAMKFVAPIAASAGIDIDTLSALIGRLGSNGIHASLAGTALRAMILSLAAPSAQAQKALSALNVAVSKNLDGSINLVKTLKDLNKAQIDLTAARDIFQRRAAPAALALIKETELIEDLRDGAEKASGAAQKMVDILLKNLFGAVVKLKSAFEGLLIAIGEPLLKPLTVLIEVVTKIVQIFVTAAKEYKTLTLILTVGTGIVAGLTLALGGLLTATVLATKATLALITTYKTLIATKIGGAIASDIISLKAYIVATWGAVAATAAFKAALITLGAIGIVGVIILVDKAISKFIEWRKEVNKNKEAAEELAKSIPEAYRENTKKIEEETKKLLESAKDIKNMTAEETEEYEKQALELVKIAGELERRTILEEDIFNDTEKEVESLRKIGQQLHEVVKKTNEHQRLVSGPLLDSYRALPEQMREFEKSAKKAYNEAIKAAEKYAQEVLEWQEKIRYERLSTEDKIRELQRKNLTDYEAWNDEKIQAEEKLEKAKEIISKKTSQLTEQDFKLFEKLARDAQTLYTGLAREVTNQLSQGEQIVEASLNTTTNEAIAGVRQVEKLFIQMYEIREKAAENSRKKNIKEADIIMKKLDEVTAQRDVGIRPKLVDIEKFVKDTNKRLKELDLKAEIRLEPEIKANGREIGITKRARGGQLPGDSKKDSIMTLMRPGEWAINNEAAKNWSKTFGEGFMPAINAPWSMLGRKIKATLLGAVPRFNLGGVVQKRFAPNIPAYANGGQIGSIKNLGSISLNIGNRSFPIMGNIDVIQGLKDAVEKENLVRSNV